MRLLVLAFACAKHRDRVDAVRDSWARDLRDPHDLVFLGDDSLVKSRGGFDIWACVQAGSRFDTYAGLPIKLLHGLRRARTLPWDYLLKLDDDTYLHADRLLEYLAPLDRKKPIYLGNGFRISANNPDGADVVLLAGGKFLFHSGGAGYVLSRPAFERMWPALDVALCREGAEDVIVGAVAQRSGVETICAPERFEPFCSPAGILDGKLITSHYFKPEQLLQVHAELRQRARARVAG